MPDKDPSEQSLNVAEEITRADISRLIEIRDGLNKTINNLIQTMENNKLVPKEKK